MKHYLSQKSAARLLGVNRQTLLRDRKRPRGERLYPAPVALVDGLSALYSREDILTFKDKP